MKEVSSTLIRVFLVGFVVFLISTLPLAYKEGLEDSFFLNKGLSLNSNMDKSNLF